MIEHKKDLEEATLFAVSWDYLNPLKIGEK